VFNPVIDTPLGSSRRPNSSPGGQSVNGSSPHSFGAISRTYHTLSPSTGSPGAQQAPRVVTLPIVSHLKHMSSTYNGHLSASLFGALAHSPDHLHMDSVFADGTGAVSRGDTPPPRSRSRGGSPTQQQMTGAGLRQVTMHLKYHPTDSGQLNQLSQPSSGHVI
jgi:hypothetical protein